MRRRFHSRFAAVFLAAALLPHAAQAADFGFAATYRIALSGFELGEARLEGKFDGGGYRIDGRGKLTGLAGAIVEYRGSASAAGRYGADGVFPTAFSVDATDGEKTTKVRMRMEGREVRQVSLVPPPPKKEHPKRVLLSEADRRGVIDPMSALMVFGVVQRGELSTAVCDRTLELFNGRERFDIALSFARRIKIDQIGYSGPAVVCNARYRPISGHRSDRDEVKYFSDRAAEVVYIPVKGGGFAMPYRVALPTPLGQGSLTLVALDRTLPGRRSARR